MRFTLELKNPLLGVAVVVCSASALVAVCFLSTFLMWNRTPSMPLGLYRLKHGAPVSRGTVVAFPIPHPVRKLVLERRYLTGRDSLTKEVAALPGDEVCTAGNVLTINGRVFGPVQKSDSMGRPLPTFQFCGSIPEGAFFAASRHQRSFDSRVFGLVPLAEVKGTVTALWTY